MYIYLQYLFTVKVTVNSNNILYEGHFRKSSKQKYNVLNIFHLQYTYIYNFEVGLTVSNVIQQHYSTSLYSKYMNSFIRNHFGVHM